MTTTTVITRIYLLYLHHTQIIFYHLHITDLSYEELGCMHWCAPLKVAKASQRF